MLSGTDIIVLHVMFAYILHIHFEYPGILHRILYVLDR